MQFSSNNFGHKERRLIYKAPPEGEGQLDRVSKAAEQLHQDPDVIAEKGIQEALALVRKDNTAKETFLRKIKQLVFTKNSLRTLREKLTASGVELQVSADGKKVEGVEIKTVAPVAKPAPNPNAKPIKLGPDGKPLPPEAPTKVQVAVSKLGETIKQFIKALMPLIKSIQKIVNDIKKMISGIAEDFRYDSSILATEDRLIDKQIADSELSDLFLNRHKDNTIRDIKAIDKASDPAAIQKKKDHVAALKAAKEKKLSGAKAEDIEKITNDLDGQITRAEKAVSDMEAKQRSGKTRRPVLIARLAAINSRMGFVADNGLNGPSSASRYVSPDSTEGAPAKTAQQIADEAKEAAEKEALDKAQQEAKVAFNALKTTVEAGTEIKIAEDDMNENVVALREILADFEDEGDHKKILKYAGIYTPVSGGTATYEITLTHATDDAYRIYYEGKIIKIRSVSSDTEQ